MNRYGRRDIEMRQADALAAKLNRFGISFFLIERQSTGTGDVQACAVLTGKVEHGNLCQFAFALDAKPEVIAHVIDTEIIGQLDMIKGQGICRLVIGRAGDYLVVGDDRT